MYISCIDEILYNATTFLKILQKLKLIYKKNYSESYPL